MTEADEWLDLREKENHPSDVIVAILRLSRALRRCPSEKGKESFPPAVGRLLYCVSKNSGVSSRKLCKLLDLRPSSLSELLSKGEAAGLLERTADENDRRIQHVALTAKGQEAVDRMEAEREEAYRKKISCFSEEEARQFCELSRRLTSHLESLDRPLTDNRPGRRKCPSENNTPDPPPSPEGHQPTQAPQPDEAEEQVYHRIFPEGARFRS